MYLFGDLRWRPQNFRQMCLVHCILMCICIYVCMCSYMYVCSRVGLYMVEDNIANTNNTATCKMNVNREVSNVRFQWLCMCVCVCMYLRMFAAMMCTYVSVCVCTCVCMYVCMYVYVCVYVYVCMYVCMYVCTSLELCKLSGWAILFIHIPIHAYIRAVCMHTYTHEKVHIWKNRWSTRQDNHTKKKRFSKRSIRLDSLAKMRVISRKVQ